MNKKYKILLVLLVINISVSAQAEAAKYIVIPENPGPGDPVTVGIRDDMRVISAVLVSNGARIAKADFFRVPGNGESVLYAAVLAVPSTAKPGRAIIAIEGVSAGTDSIAELVIDISGREFISEYIDLNKALTDMRTKPDPQKTAESEQLWAILGKTGNEVHCLGNFIPPVNSTRRTSAFGVRRIYRYSDGSSDPSVHAGIDYGVPKGTPVGSCGPGRVVFARHRIITGNSVIIEHLPGGYSLYYHLDEISVSEGALVAAGTLLGLSGATGLATGPHLHWEIRISGENADPDAFISRPILDKDLFFR